MSEKATDDYMIKGLVCPRLIIGRRWGTVTYQTNEYTRVVECGYTHWPDTAITEVMAREGFAAIVPQRFEDN